MRAATALAIGALALGSRQGPSLSQRQHDEVTDIADDSISDSAKIKELEARIDDLEDRINRTNTSQ